MITHPSAAGLIGAVMAYLETEDGPQGGYMARVARNALAIAQRDITLGQAADARAAARLRDLLGCDGDLQALEEMLCARLRDGAQDPDDPALRAHLRAQVLDHLAIDQPGYKTALRP